jgi:hypothetical protein
LFGQHRFECLDGVRLQQGEPPGSERFIDDICAAGNQNERQVWPPTTHQFGKCQSVDFGHADIREDEIDAGAVIDHPQGVVHR